MNITISYTLQPTERAEYDKLLNVIYPTKPLYLFLAVSTVLLVIMSVQHFSNQSTYTLVCMSISLLGILLGGSILLSTKKSLPRARSYLDNNLGKSCCYLFTDAFIKITTEGEELTYSWDKFIGQYHSNRHYVFCFAERTQLIPTFIGITPENIDALNAIVMINNARGVKLKKLKLK